MNRDLENFHDKESLELHLFKVLEFGEVEFPKYTENKIDDIFGWSASFGKVVGEENNKVIIIDKGGNYYYDKFGKLQLKIGDIGIIKDNYFVKIEGEIDFNKINRIYDEHNWSRLDLDELEGTILSEKFFEDEIEKNKILDLEKERLKKLEEKKVEKKQIDRNEVFKKTGIYNHDDKEFKINGNVCFFLEDKDEEHRKITLNKEWREVFELSELINGYYRRSDYCDSFRSFLIDKKESFIESEKKDGIYQEIYNIKFGDKVFFNEVPISYIKLKFILNRLNKEDLHNKEMISKYNKLSGMKADLVDLKEIEITNHNNYYGGSGNIRIPIKISLSYYDDLLKINCFGKEVDLNWEKCKEIFFMNGSTRRVDYSLDLNKIMSMVSVEYKDRQIIYDYVKKVVMLKSLGETNNED